MESLRRALEGIQRVFHLAGLTKAIDLADYERVNAQGTANMARACAEAGVEHLVLLSSLAAAGPSFGDRPRIETDTEAPMSAYGVSKLQGERAAREAGVGLTILRPPAVYGARDRDVFWFFAMAKRRLLLQLADWQARLSVIYVEDLVDGLLLAGERVPRDGALYYVAEEKSYSWKEVFDILNAVVPGHKVRLRLPVWIAEAAAGASEWVGRRKGTIAPFTREKLHQLRAGSWICDPGKAGRELGFHAQVSFADGAARTYRWYREQRWL